MNRVIIAGSPRSNGRSAHLAEMLFEANIDECPEDEIYLIPVSELDINPCIACGACRKETEVVLEGDDGEEVRTMMHCCIIDDEMQDVYPLLDAADELIVVSPVFFSGAPASLKALLDRLQPHFWALTRERPKRPATLHVIGEGGDPHGYAPLVSEVRSATAVAGFRLERVLDWVGKIDASGEIVAEAEVVEDTSGQAASPEASEEAKQPGQAPAARRPKLDLSAGDKGSQSRGSAAREGGRTAQGQASKSHRQQTQAQPGKQGQQRQKKQAQQRKNNQQQGLKQQGQKQQKRGQQRESNKGKGSNRG